MPGAVFRRGDVRFEIRITWYVFNNNAVFDGWRHIEPWGAIRTVYRAVLLKGKGR